MRYLVSVLTELPKPESGPRDSFIAMVDTSTELDAASQWTDHKRDCTTLSLDIFLEIISPAPGAPAFVLPAGLLNALTCLALVHLHVQSELRVKVRVDP